MRNYRRIFDGINRIYGILLPKLIGSGFKVQRLQLSETAYYINRDLAYPISPIW